MFEDVTVIGAGRAGTAIAARLRERGVSVRDGGELRLLCVPDRAIAEVAARDRARPVGRARLRRDAARGARPAHEAASRCIRCRRSKTTRGPEQLDGAWAADHRGRRTRHTLARSGSPGRSVCVRSSSPTTAARSTTQALRSRRTSSSRCIGSASRLTAEAGAPPEALVPLMTRTIENGFELTGPIARGDWETVERHREVLRGTDVQALYDTLMEATRA